ncbi:MAG: alpha/beta fold hydrolase [Clostridia bacterium]|nr:alpha/beta fold hydrolase [Clostridia bacterium]
MKRIIFALLTLIFCLCSCSHRQICKEEPKATVSEKEFIIKNEGCELNATYTYVDDEKAHPAVLLIAGSGPSDLNGTIGNLKPLYDIASGLAKEGINTLRIDKRTLNHASSFKVSSGLNEEYFSDCKKALEFLKEQNISSLYLLGHSMGGQIAAELAKNDPEIDGIILFNSSARHLADIMYDQLSLADPDNASYYRAYAELAKDCSLSSAKGYYYFGASDYYWSSYNELDTIKSIQESNISTLIINSNYDRQSFPEDISLWQENFRSSENVSIYVYDDISHFGYKIDTSEPSSIYGEYEFPSELIDQFSDFLNQPHVED